MKSCSPFTQAAAVWPRELSGISNGFAGFRAVFPARRGRKALLRIAGASIYRVWLNGRFLAHGPARAAHGFARVDEIPLDARLVGGRNVLAVEVAGYEVNSYYVLDQPSFLQAEVLVDGRVVAATSPAGGGFDARVLAERVRNVQRFSWQRTFIEAYRLAPGCDAWRRDPAAPAGTAACERRRGVQLLPRAVAFPRYAVRRPRAIVSRGRLVPHVPEKLWKDRALVKVGPKYKGYPEEALAFVLSTELQQFASRRAGGKGSTRAVGALGAGEYAILDFGVNGTGFIRLQVSCAEPTRLVPVFDEMLSGGEVDFKRLSCTAAMSYELAPGTYRLESLEPYVFRYLKLLVLSGRCRVTAVYQRELANPDAGAARFACDDPGLNAIFEAGRETFRQNVVDIYMDCPSRERAGWLCDSFFMGRVEQDLCGHSRVERNFLENFLLPPSFANLPDGMLPMCYPADHPNGTFIPNWALWFVLELEEYLARTGDRALVDALQAKVLGVLQYFERFRNADGLLEKLESWVFIEWSKANAFVQDVNYPSNMLYAGALDAAGRLYGRADLCATAGQVRETVRAQSFDGTFFADNAVRTDGRLEVTRNRTETCQYYAFFFGVATPARDPELWRKLVEEFGPRRTRQDLHPDIPPSNAFIGSYLRMELLSRYGTTLPLLREMKNFLLPMVKLTGTLWENLTASASCNHGFASHACHVLLRDALGVAEVDTRRRAVRIVLPRTALRRCEGRIPVAGGFVFVRWQKCGRTIRLHSRAPAGYTVSFENRSGCALQQES